MGLDTGLRKERWPAVRSPSLRTRRASSTRAIDFHLAVDDNIRGALGLGDEIVVAIKERPIRRSHPGSPRVSVPGVLRKRRSVREARHAEGGPMGGVGRPAPGHSDRRHCGRGAARRQQARSSSYLRHPIPRPRPTAAEAVQYQQTDTGDEGLSRRRALGLRRAWCPGCLRRDGGPRGLPDAGGGRAAGCPG
jgi:hypothetical protein